MLEQGCVVEVGTHDELLKKGGYYSRLYSMQFASQAEATSQPYQSVIRLSHELRNRLNSMIGLLRLLLDDMVESVQERQELIEESYKSAGKILNTIDVFDDIINLHENCQSALLLDKERTDSIDNQNLKGISDEFRRSLNSMLASLRSLSESKTYTSKKKQQEFIQDAYQAAMGLIDNIKSLESHD